MDQDTAQLLMGLAKLVKEASQQGRYKHDLPSGYSVTSNLMHGVGGIFGAAGIERDVFSTRVTPRGLARVLPAMGTIDTHPIVGYLTGFTAGEAGSEQTYPCDDPLKAGEIKSCFEGSAFGRISRKTAELQLVDIGTRTNRGEFLDLRVLNDPIVTEGFGIPNIPGVAADWLNREIVARLLALAAEFENVIYPMIYTGNPANNTAGGGYMEFNGLERLVKTGHVDVLTNASCPSLDSDIKDFNYKTVENDAADLFSVMTMMYRYVKHNAIRMNMMPVTWVWVMRGELFNQLVDVWPCVYASYRCSGPTNNVDAMEMRALSDEMRNGEFLRIDGVDIPVVIDDAIPEDTSTTNGHVGEGQYASDIYLLPLTVRGGRSVLYFEYRDFNQGVAQAIADARLGNIAYVSDGGRFLWYSQFTNGCFSLAATIEPRLRLLTPHLAGRIQNVVYQPLQHFRNPFADDAYFVDGGNYSGLNWSPYYGS